MNNSEKLLIDREQRATLQNELQSEYQKTLVVIKANYPSNNKITNFSNYLVTKVFFIVKKQVSLIDYQTTLTNEGLIFYLICEDSLLVTKRKMIEIENSEFTRLVDIDVYYNFQTISREDLNKPARLCYLCDNEARVCSRKQTHTLVEVINYFNKQVINDIFSENLWSNLALYGLINELLKPIGFGGVTISSQGSHHDMDYKTFITSIEAIVAMFWQFDTINHNSFNELRTFGLDVEKAMFRTTNNINTHKGCIFSLILIFAGVRISQNYSEISLNIKRLCQDIYDDFNNKFLKDSNGQNIYDRYKIKGIREQAFLGYQSIFDVFEPYYSQTKDSTKTMLLLIAYLDDTTIIKRSNLEMLKNIQKKASEIVDKEDQHHIFSEYLIENNISCGGSADLLTLVFILNLLKEHYY